MIDRERAVKWGLRGALGLTGALVAFAAGVIWYGSRDVVPSGVTIAGWPVGGMRYEAVLGELSAREKAMAVRSVTLAPERGSGLAERAMPLGQLGWRVSAEAVRGTVAEWRSGSRWQRAWKRWHARGSDVRLEASLEPGRLQAAADGAWPELPAEQPVDARRIITAQDDVVVEPEKLARRVDKGELAGRLKALFPQLWREAGAQAPNAAPLRVALPLMAVRPKVTAESLRSQGVDRRIAIFSTAYTSSGEGRSHNIEATASIVNDTLLAPGDIFDYGKFVKETERKLGYRQSTVIVDGNFAPGIGGGICQVSTTLYGAVLRAGLEIVERKHHSLPISYVPIGQDATFSSGWINFRFRNNTGAYLLVRTMTAGEVLTVKLFGRTDPSVRYLIESTTTKVIEPPAKYVRNPALPRGAVKLLKTGKPGYVVETYRYKQVNGKTVGKELISRDTYQPQPVLFASNASNRTDGAPEGPHRIIVEDGVDGPIYGSR